MSHSLSVTEQKIAYDNTKLWSKFDSPYIGFLGEPYLFFISEKHNSHYVVYFTVW